MTPEQRYLELLKQSLAFSLWPQPPIPIRTMDYARSPLWRTIIAFTESILGKARMGLVQRFPIGQGCLIEANHWYGETMSTKAALDNVQQCVETVLNQCISGDLIETGVWRGGVCILMKGILTVYGSNRTVFVADSFEGLPKPERPQDKGDGLHRVPFLSVSQEEVEANFTKYGLLDNVVFLKGWFKDTLPSAPIGRLAILRLDGDMYGSTMDALTALYPKLSSGGFCIIDDYGIRGCHQAVDDYRAAHEVTRPLQPIDEMRVYWRK